MSHPPTSLHLHHPPQYLISPPSLSPVTPSLSSGSAGVHMIKRGAQVITWRCQIKRPLIQMRSEISKQPPLPWQPLTHPRRRRRGDLRAPGRGGGTCGEATTTLGTSSLSLSATKYQRRSQRSQTRPGSPERVYLDHIACLSVNSRRWLGGGRSAPSTRGLFFFAFLFAAPRPDLTDGLPAEFAEGGGVPESQPAPRLLFSL